MTSLSERCLSHRLPGSLHGFVVTVLLLVSSAGLPAQTLRGVVVDLRTGQPVGNVEVQVYEVGTRSQVVPSFRTDDEGRFHRRLDAPGSFDVQFRRVGYAALMVTDIRVVRREVRHLDVGLTHRPVPLAEVQVVPPSNARPFFMDGFEQRRRMGIGSFLTRAEIETKGISSLMQVVRGLSGVSVSTRPGRASVTAGQRDMMRACNLVLFIDGRRASNAHDSPDVVFRNFEMIPVSHIEALEVYRGTSQLPAQFAGPDVRCGAVVVWTRRPGLDAGAPPDGSPGGGTR